MTRSGSRICTASSMAMERLRISSPLNLPWAFSVSAICLPMVITGLSEYFGSCKTMAMRPPRKARRSCAGAFRRSMPSNSSFLAVIFACGGVRPMMARPVWDLPEPDSPTMPRRSRPSSKLTPRTASTAPVRVGKVTRRSSTVRRGFIGCYPADRVRRAGRRPIG